MTFSRILCAAALAVVVPLSSPVQAAPLPGSGGMTAQPENNVINVRWRGYGYGGWHRHGWRHGYRGYGWGPAVGGFVAGAAIGSAVANSRAQAADDDAYCSQRFKSYDPASGTYLGYDGIRHPCP